MTRKSILINVGLLLLIGLLGWRLQVTTETFKRDNDIGKIRPAQDPKKGIHLEGGIAPQPGQRLSNPADFAAIPNQNLFSESRAKEEKTDAAAAAPVAPALNPRPVLLGVTIFGRQRFASIIDPTTGGAPGARGRTQTKRIGDIYLGYTITDITPTEMVLEYGPQRESIPLFDTTKARTGGGKTPILMTRVINFAASGSQAAGVDRGAAAAGAARVQPPPTPTPPGSPPQQPGAVQPAQGIIRTPAQSTGRQVPGNQPTTWNEGVDAQGRRILRTPFGDIPRERPPNP